MRGSYFGANPGWVERHYLSVGRCSVSDVSDAQLVADARCGDKRALSELVARHRGRNGRRRAVATGKARSSEGHGVVTPWG